MSEKRLKIIYITACIIIGFLMGGSLYICLSDKYTMVSVDNIRTIIIDMMGLIVSTILLFGITPNSLKGKQDRALTRLIVVMCLIMFFDIRYSFMEGRIGIIEADLIHIKIEYAILGICHDMMLYCYWSYVREEIHLQGTLLKVGNIVCRSLIGLCILVKMLNPMFDSLVVFSSHGDLTASRHRSMSDVVALIIFTLTVIAITKRKEYPHHQKIILLTFVIFPIIASVVGFAFEFYELSLPAYMFSLLVIYINIFSKQRHKIVEQQIVMEKQNTALMISQIQPHFLYNVLTTIANLCEKDPIEARDTTIMFSSYLRGNLDSLRTNEPVPFDEELDHIKVYTELEKKRFKNKINVRYEVEDHDFVVPSLGLQPLVENAVKHGLCKKEEPGTLVISSKRTQGGHLVTIEDDGVGFDPDKAVPVDGRSHVGLTNTINRLEKMCGAKVNIVSAPGNGCRVEVLFPYVDIHNR